MVLQKDQTKPQHYNLIQQSTSNKRKKYTNIPVFSEKRCELKCARLTSKQHRVFFHTAVSNRNANRKCHNTPLNNQITSQSAVGGVYGHVRKVKMIMKYVNHISVSVAYQFLL